MLKNAGLFVAVVSFFACTSNIKIKKNESEYVYKNKRAKLYEGFQTNVTFPINSKYYDESVLTNNFVSFTGFKGQGVIYVQTESVKSFDLYLNDIAIDTKKLCRYGNSVIDISKLVKNGKNRLYIAHIQPASKHKRKKPLINLKIPYPILKTGIPVKNYAVNIIDSLITEEIKHGFPGVQLLIVKDGKIIKNSAYGYISTVDQSGKTLTPSSRQPITSETLFDIASNTKMYAVNFALQKLVSEKKLSIDDKVSSFFPQFKDKKEAKIKGKEEITVRDLLKHQAGFPAGGLYFKRKDYKKHPGIQKRQVTFNMLMETPLVYGRGSRTIYSDIDYMILGFIIEQVTGQPLDIYIETEIYKPLNLDRICYTPLNKGFTKKDCAATEISGIKRTAKAVYNPLEKSLIHGYVHDPEAFFAMDGISGHAGLFSNALNLAVLAQLMLNGGGYGSVKLFDISTASLFSSQSGTAYTYGLGWRRQGGKQNYAWCFSQLASDDTFGHTGWTGSLTIIDPLENLIIILLTNAKNTPPTRSRYTNGRFEGDYYLIKNYGAVTTLIYAAILNKNKVFIDNMITELLERRYEMLKESSSFNNAGYIKDLAALTEAVSKQSKNSLKLRLFLHSPKGKEIKAFLQKKKYIWASMKTHHRDR